MKLFLSYIQLTAILKPRFRAKVKGQMLNMTRSWVNWRSMSLEYNYPQALITQPLCKKQVYVSGKVFLFKTETYSTKTRGARRAGRPRKSRFAGFSIWSFRTLCRTSINNKIKLVVIALMF